MTKKRHRRGRCLFYVYRKKRLFLSALLAYEVGSAKTDQQDDARAEGGVSVASATMTRYSRATVAAFEVGAFLLRGVAALEEAAAISEGGHAQSVDDGKG